MKLLSSVPSLLCALVITAGVIGNAPKANAQESGAVSTSAPAQGAASDSTSAPDLSGNWQMSWVAGNGNQRQATMQIKQNGSKLSGDFQGERGSAPFKGTLKGNKISFTIKMRRRKISFSGTVDGGKMSGTTQQGTSWTASRQ